MIIVIRVDEAGQAQMMYEPMMEPSVLRGILAKLVEHIDKQFHNGQPPAGQRSPNSRLIVPPPGAVPPRNLREPGPPQ